MLIANARNMADTRDATTACMKLWVSSFSAFWEKSYWKVREMGNCGCPGVGRHEIVGVLVFCNGQRRALSQRSGKNPTGRSGKWGIVGVPVFISRSLESRG